MSEREKMANEASLIRSRLDVARMGIFGSCTYVDSERAMRVETRYRLTLSKREQTDIVAIAVAVASIERSGARL